MLYHVGDSRHTQNIQIDIGENEECIFYFMEKNQWTFCQPSIFHLLNADPFPLPSTLLFLPNRLSCICLLDGKWKRTGMLRQKIRTEKNMVRYFPLILSLGSHLNLGVSLKNSHWSLEAFCPIPILLASSNLPRPSWLPA